MKSTYYLSKDDLRKRKATKITLLESLSLKETS